MVESEIYPTTGWGIADFSVGFLIGFYGPLQARWRNYDCRSAFYKLGTNVIGYSTFFDKPFEVEEPMTWVRVFLRSLLTSYLIYGMGSKCAKQYKNTFSDPWYENFGFLSGDVKPMVQASESDYTTLQTVANSIMLALEIWGIYANGKSKYYYFFLGKVMGAFLTTLFVSADAWAGSGIITPIDPWILYDT